MAATTKYKPNHAAGMDAKVCAYIDGVMTGQIVVCNYVRQAVERHLRDIEHGHERGLWFDAQDASFALEFIQLMSHSKGQWANSLLVLEPWQAFIIWCVFGWKKPAEDPGKHPNGVRRFNTAFVSVARKNGKSTLGAAVGLKLLIADREGGAEVYSAATKRDQAKIVHEEAKRMVRSSAFLKTTITVLRDVLSVESTNSSYKPLGADADTLDGLSPSGVIIDELHAHKTRAVWDVMETGTGARPNPLTLGITTAGDSGDQESIYWELKGWTTKVLAGLIDDDSWFGIIFTLDDDDDWTDPNVWIKANPNLRVSVKFDDLERKCRKAKETPSAVANFRRKHCNQETAEASAPWLADQLAIAWDASSVGDFYDADGLTEEAIARFRGRDCCVGGDLSSISDLTALCFAFPDADGFCDLLSFCWCPRDNAVGRTRDKRVPYMAWADAGLLTLTEGNSVDYDEIRGLLRRARDVWKWNINKLAFDPNNARYLLTKIVKEDGFPVEQVIEHLQTTGAMNEPIGITEKLILDGKLRNGGHAPLRWCVSNALTYKDTGGRRRFNKKAIREKIDLGVAMVMAVGLAMTTPVVTDSIYNTPERELMFL